MSVRIKVCYYTATLDHQFISQVRFQTSVSIYAPVLDIFARESSPGPPSSLLFSATRFVMTVVRRRFRHGVVIFVARADLLIRSALAIRRRRACALTRLYSATRHFDAKTAISTKGGALFPEIFRPP